ncbi:hypothetical protein [Desulfobacter curvatus]|uniref:hypothetical protein n=1 Tax=Desulfobacter curvatus TaxID=2290 RepID=UPI00035E7B5E|nr:hypothetical protein [Desulfobacter curvatus]
MNSFDQPDGYQEYILKCNDAFLQFFPLGLNNEFKVLDKQAIIRNDQAIHSSLGWCILNHKFKTGMDRIIPFRTGMRP